MQELINQTIYWVIGKARRLAEKVGQALDFAKDLTAKKDKEKQNGRADFGDKIPFQIGSETHHLWVEIIGGTPQVMIASQGQNIDQVLEIITNKLEKVRTTDDIKQEVRDRLLTIKGLISDVEILATKLSKKRGISSRDRKQLQTTLENITVHIRRIAQLLIQSGEGIGLQRRQNVVTVSYHLDKQEGRSTKNYVGTLVVVSGEDKWPIPEHRFFITREIGGFSRAYDSEVKALEYIAHLVTKSPKMNKNVTGVVGIYSEFPLCPSCSGVVAQFRYKFPNVTVEVQEGAGKNEF